MTRNDLLKSYLQELYPAEVRSKSRRERFRRFFSHGLAGFFMANMALSISKWATLFSTSPWDEISAIT